VAGAAPISDREAQILAALGAHLTNAQIATRLHLSVRTVESHVSSLLRKLGAPDRRVLADLAPALTERRQPAEAIAGLPAQWTSFVGRAAELVETAAALEGARLVTLLGPGGVGKTRLAAEAGRAVGERFRNGGAFVELVPVSADFVVPAVAAAFGVTGRAGQRLDDDLVEHLAPRSALLILDNCEHLLGPVADLGARLLAACPHVTVLTSSRERIGLPGERIVLVPPLSVVAQDGDAVPEAVRLFLERAYGAGAARPDDLADAVELCSGLDGMPLAIELAAARAGSLGAAGLRAGLADRLRLLAGGRSADERHRSLRAVLDWSHSLLDDDERQMLRRLAAFAGSFDLSAVTEVAADGDAAVAVDLLGRLGDKSLVAYQPAPVGRWRLLETVRSYALDRLVASGEQAAVQDRHLVWATGTAGRLEGQLAADEDWQAEFDVVADDLRAALGSSRNRAGAAMAVRLGMSLGHLAFGHRFVEEAVGHYEQTAELAPDPATAALAMLRAAEVCQAEVNTGGAFDRLLRAAELAAEGGDAALEADCLARAVVAANRFPAGIQDDIPHERLTELLDAAHTVAPSDARVVAQLSQAAAWNASGEKLTVDPELADQALALARASDDPTLVSAALDAVISGHLTAGRLRAAHRLARERMDMLDELPRHVPAAAVEITDTLHMANEQALAAGELPIALRDMRKAQDDDVMAVLPFNASSKLMLSLALTGEFAQARSVGELVWSGWLAAGSPTARWMAPALLGCALAHGLCGDADTARTWQQRAQAVMGGFDLLTHRNSAGFAVFTVGRLAMHAGRFGDGFAATAPFAVGPGEWYTADNRWYYDAYGAAVHAELGVLAERPDAAEILAAVAPVGEESRWAAACLERAHGRLTGDAQHLTRSVELWTAIDARFERACTLLLLPDRAVEGRAELAAIGAVPPVG